MLPIPPHSLILLADDDVMIRNLVRTSLERTGYKVLIAADGREALELSQAHEDPINLLILDVEMPNLDGLSTYRQISLKRPYIKVLFMSGRISSQLALPSSVPFLHKPFEMSSILKKVNDLLPIEPPELKVVLVVDHNESRTNRTKTILVENGYAVLVARSVEAAEGIADSIAKIDLIISGVVFPGRSGVNLAEHVRASKRGISTLLVSHFYPDMLRNMKGFSAQPEFLQNPFTAEELLKRVRRLLGST